MRSSLGAAIIAARQATGFGGAARRTGMSQPAFFRKTALALEEGGEPLLLDEVNHVVVVLVEDRLAVKSPRDVGVGEGNDVTHQLGIVVGSLSKVAYITSSYFYFLLSL